MKNILKNWREFNNNIIIETDTPEARPAVNPMMDWLEAMEGIATGDSDIFYDTRMGNLEQLYFGSETHGYYVWEKIGSADPSIRSLDEIPDRASILSVDEIAIRINANNLDDTSREILQGVIDADASIKAGLAEVAEKVPSEMYRVKPSQYIKSLIARVGSSIKRIWNGLFAPWRLNPPHYGPGHRPLGKPKFFGYEVPWFESAPARFKAEKAVGKITPVPTAGKPGSKIRTGGPSGKSFVDVDDVDDVKKVRDKLVQMREGLTTFVDEVTGEESPGKIRKIENALNAEYVSTSGRLKKRIPFRKDRLKHVLEIEKEKLNIINELIANIDEALPRKTRLAKSTWAKRVLKTLKTGGAGLKNVVAIPAVSVAGYMIGVVSGGVLYNEVLPLIGESGAISLATLDLMDPTGLFGEAILSAAQYVYAGAVKKPPHKRTPLEQELVDNQSKYFNEWISNKAFYNAIAKKGLLRALWEGPYGVPLPKSANEQFMDYVMPMVEENRDLPWENIIDTYKYYWRQTQHGPDTFGKIWDRGPTYEMEDEMEDEKLRLTHKIKKLESFCNGPEPPKIGTQKGRARHAAWVNCQNKFKKGQALKDLEIPKKKPAFMREQTKNNKKLKIILETT